MERPVSTTVKGRALVPGTARGTLLVAREPLSFWGGYDPETGEIIDRRHPLSGTTATGAILAIPSTRGSSTTTAVLLESVRRGTAPAALLCEGTDAFLALAAVVAEELYGKTVPVIALDATDFATLRSGATVEIRQDGTIEVGCKR